MNDPTGRRDQRDRRRLLLLAAAFLVSAAVAFFAIFLVFDGAQLKSRKPGPVSDRHTPAADNRPEETPPRDSRPAVSGTAEKMPSPAAVLDTENRIPAKAGTTNEDRIPAKFGITNEDKIPPETRITNDTPPLDPESPWFEPFAASADLPPVAEEVGFGEFDFTKFIPRRDDIRAWFDQVPGQSLALKEIRSRVGMAGQFQGLMRLRMPWRDDVALRLAMIDRKSLQIHFFRGQTGLTLKCYERDREGWAAYATQRKPGQPRPELWALTASDDGRSRRSGFFERGTFELRCDGREIVVSRGDLVLLRAPLDGWPDDVYVEGQATLLGVQAIRSGTFEQPAVADAILDTDQPATLAWEEGLPDQSRLERLPDGSLVLSATDADATGWASTVLPPGGPREILLEIDEATVGTGVFLGREDGKPREVVRFIRDRRSGQMVLAVRDDDLFEQDFPDPKQNSVPYVSEHCWIRLLFGCGVLRWWVGVDGQHWAQGESLWGEQPGGVTSVGLHHVRGLETARIRLRRLIVRPLPGFASLVDPELLAFCPSLAHATNVDDFAIASQDAQPDGVALADWESACAVRTIGDSCARELGRGLMLRVLDEARETGTSADRQLAALDEAWLLVDARSDKTWSAALLDRYHAVGKQAYVLQDSPPYSTIRPALLRFPSNRQQNPEIADSRLIRLELLDLMVDRRWDAVADYIRRLRYFAEDGTCPLLPWAEYTTWQHGPGRIEADRKARRQPDWVQPLVVELDKQTYNIIAELQSMIDSEAFENAARLIASLENDNAQGLAPHVSDPDLFVALPTAVQAAMERHPELTTAIASRFGQVAELRVRAAIQQQDLAALELATVQFAGLDAAAEAHRWLGDRALAAGWFATALEHFQQAELSAGPSFRAELQSRAQLAAAISGQSVAEPVDVAIRSYARQSVGRHGGQPADVAIELGGFRVEASSLQQIVTQLGQSRVRETALTTDGRPSGILALTSLKVQQRVRLEGPQGREPKPADIPRASNYHVDWPGRQLAAVLDGDTLFLANRFSVTAYDANTVHRLWQSPPPNGSPMSSQAWGLIPMRPLVTTTRIFARQLYGQSPMLVCLDCVDGRIVWSCEPPASWQIISDPLLIRGSLVVLALARQDQGTSVLQWIQVDRTTGEVTGQKDLLRLRDAWWSRRCCEVVPAHGGMIAVLGGVTLRCDANGRLKWLRRQLALPGSIEHGWIRQHFERPLLDGNAVYVAQPGVRTVERMDASSGRQIWTRVLPDVERLVGKAADAVIVLVDGGLLALDSETGRTLWRYEAKGISAHAACNASYVFFATVDAAPANTGDRALRMVWLDAASGQTTGYARLDDLDVQNAHLGPLVFHRDQILACYGQEGHTAGRELLRLVPDGPVLLRKRTP